MGSSAKLNTRIDLLKKRIETKGTSLPVERQRLYRKRLKRLQRAHRTALAVEKKLAARSKGTAEGAPGGAETPPAT